MSQQADRQESLVPRHCVQHLRKPQLRLARQRRVKLLLRHYNPISPNSLQRQRIGDKAGRTKVGDLLQKASGRREDRWHRLCKIMLWCLKLC